MRRRRAIPGEPIEAPSVLDQLVPPDVGQLLGDLRAVAHIGATFADLREKRRKADAGVIDLVEVQPGVFAAPRRPPPPRDRGRFGQLQGIVHDFDQLARALHGRRR